MIITHIITSLGRGGAEKVLFRLVINDKDNKHFIIVLTKGGLYIEELLSFGLTVHVIDFNKLYYLPVNIYSLIKTLRRIRPDVVQTWMFHADLIGGISAYILSINKIIWNVRGTFGGKLSLSNRLVKFLHKKASFFIPNKIVCCSSTIIKVFKKNGYSKNKFVYIPNGFELNEYYPSDAFKSSMRDTFKIPFNKFVVGMIARFHDQKNHIGLIHSLKLLFEKGYDIFLVLVGKDVDYTNQKLVKYIKSLGLQNNILLLGDRSDVSQIINMFDLSVLVSKYGEGFPNVLAESMLCEIPCVSTNIGDSKILIDSSGWVVEFPNATEISSAIELAFIEKVYAPYLWEKRKKSSRQHIIDNYSLKSMINHYKIVWFN